MALSPEEREVKKIEKATVKSMEILQTYRPQFMPTIKAYAQMRRQFDCLWKEFSEGGYQTTEAYTNKNGNTNIRKTAIYLSIETLRRDIVNYENILGLTPAGLKKINKEMETKKKKDALGEAIANAMPKL